MNYANLDHIVSRVQQRLEAGAPSDDGRVDFDLIKHAVHAARSAFIELKFRNMPFIPKVYMQRLCCLEVKCRDITCNGVNSGIKENYVAIPEVLYSLGARAFGFVGTGDGRQAFDYMPTITAAAGSPFPYGGHTPSIYTVPAPTEIILKNLPVTGMELACVEAIFSNPEDEAIMECADGPYPIGGSDVQAVEDLVFERYAVMLGIQPDQSVDAAANN